VSDATGMFVVIVPVVALRGRAGRADLSVPGGYESLVGRRSSAVIQTMPRGYKLIVHRGGA
jgi:hypothetical protein